MRAVGLQTRANALHLRERMNRLRQLAPLLGCGLLAIWGLFLLLYPALSNHLYEARQDGVIRQYTDLSETGELATLRAEALTAAQQYNRQLAAGAVSLEEPFLTPTRPTAEGVERSLLDVTGTGVIATLSVPALELELPVYYGTGSDILEHGAGLLEGTSLPVGGAGTHSVLCAHSGLPAARLFSDLEELEPGDRFSLEVLGETLTYQVDQIRTVLPEDFSLLAIEPAEDYCTLLTCTPYGVNTHRLLVRGNRVEDAEAEPSTEKPEEPAAAPSTWLREYLTSLAVGGAVAAGCLLLGRIVSALWRKRR